MTWQFWIDVGGTFTDCIARSPTGELQPIKVLSSGVTKGQVAERQGTNRFTDPLREHDPDDFWLGYDIRFFDDQGQSLLSAKIAKFHRRLGVLELDTLLPPNIDCGTRYELSAGEEAPILAIRTALGLRRDLPIPAVDVRLGTTRGTNALLTRRGARTVFVTTRGFADVLRIANQDRPRLFDLNIVKPEPLFADAIEIDERIAADGSVLVVPDEAAIRQQLQDLINPKRERGRAILSALNAGAAAPHESATRGSASREASALVDASGYLELPSLAICLLHSFANPVHEQLVEGVARELGFTEVSVSSRLAPLIKIVSRGDTTVMDAYLNPILREYVGRLRAQLAGSLTRSVSECERSTELPMDRLVERSPSLTLRVTEPGHSLRLMTSSGGLIDADRFVGKDSILSGPAGGVIGFSQVAQLAGFDKSIGFDMGGTSTDVARFDGQYEYEFETTKAGVRIVAPMLAIETVAAGGGSICAFDGIKLVVGPQSAGADPGPACYGRGGPLAVTDINLFLGRIVESRFPFPLDRAAVERRLAELAEAVGKSRGMNVAVIAPRDVLDAPNNVDEAFGSSHGAMTTTDIERLAYGFSQIANANMARAIRKISVARGYDPAEYVLVCFGGAGAQHACEIADSLGMKRILVHPLASLLSAYGIGQADVRRFAERSVLRTLDEVFLGRAAGRQPTESADTTVTENTRWADAQPLAELDHIFAELESSARAEVLAEGVMPESIQLPIRSLDLRYVGVEATIRVPCPADGDYAAKYAELHQQLFGYTHANRKLEVTAARVEVVGITAQTPPPAEPLVPRTPSCDESAQTWFGDSFVETSVFFRENLRPGDSISGPALISESSSTIVIEPGWSASVLGRGEVLLESRESLTRSVNEGERSTDPQSQATSSNESLSEHSPSLTLRVNDVADPVLLEIFNNQFASIAEQMGVTLQKTSCSTNVKERLDFSCAIFDSAGNLVVNAPHIPVHLGAMSETVKRIIEDNSDDGDVVWTPTSERTVERPDVGIRTTIGRGDVFVTNDPYRGGSHLPDVTVVTPVHDANGRLIFFTASRAHHAEIGGILPGSMPPFSKNLGEEGVLIRNFKLIDGGVSREEQLRELLLSGKYPTRNVNDNLADVRAQVAANQIGVRLLHELIAKQTQPVVEAYMRHIQAAAAIKMRLALSAIPDGEYSRTDHLDDGSAICATITKRGDSATVDFTGTGPVLSSNLNANRAIVTAAVMYVFRCLINEDIPLNGGVLEPITIVLPECLLNPMEQPDPAKSPAVVGGNVETSQRVVDVLFGALGLAAASQGTMNNLTFGDATFGYYETICGGSGATATADGADAVHTHMTNTRLTDVEVIERRYPVRVHEFSIRRGSGGAGQHRGGDGIVRKIEFLKPLNVSLLTERRGPFAPFGLNGGEPGLLGKNSLTKASTGDVIDLGGKAQITVQPGDILTIETPGGGGYGN